jgi:N-acetylmuramoyl-L-alanine amidase
VFVLDICKIRVLVVVAVISAVFSGCATTHRAGAFPTTRMNGAQYVALPAYCDARSVGQSYDQLTRVITLTQGGHKVRMVVGDTFALVDNKAYHLNSPVELSQGGLYIPDKFRQQVLEGLFIREQISAGHLMGFGRIKKVVIDAGHGGKDPGAIGRTGLYEKEVTLDIARRLGELLNAAGVETTLVRSNDKFVSLQERVRIANSAESSVFVSIHANANPSKNMRGFEVYYITPRVSDIERALSSARSEKLDLDGSFAGSPSQNLKALLWDMIHNYNRAESIALSKSICKSGTCSLDTRVIGVKSANYHVLRGTTMPAVLVEVGFLSNYSEERSLKEGSYRQGIAQAIRDGIQDFGHSQSGASDSKIAFTRQER